MIGSVEWFLDRRERNAILHYVFKQENDPRHAQKQEEHRLFRNISFNNICLIGVLIASLISMEVRNSSYVDQVKTQVVDLQWKLDSLKVCMHHVEVRNSSRADQFNERKLQVF